MSLNGILPVFKPAGISSFDVIRRLKRVRKVKKIGHGGTLDVMARGVLPILYGEATKAFDYLLHSAKQYRAVVQCGAFTDTDDAEGQVIQTIPDYEFNRETLEGILEHFRGTILQTAPRYSALKVNGQPSYKLARKAKDVPAKTREVTIHQLEVTDWDQQTHQFTLLVNCSSGTYIRSLARDIGQALGWGGYLVDLLREYSGSIRAEDCISLEDISTDNIEDRLISLESALSFLPDLELNLPEDYIFQGRPLQPDIFTLPPHEAGIYRVHKKGILLALIEIHPEKNRYLRVFRL